MFESLSRYLLYRNKELFLYNRYLLWDSCNCSIRQNKSQTFCFLIFSKTLNNFQNIRSDFAKLGVTGCPYSCTAKRGLQPFIVWEPQFILLITWNISCFCRMRFRLLFSPLQVVLRNISRNEKICLSNGEEWNPQSV